MNAQEIRTELQKHHVSSYVRKNRPLGCPMKRNLPDELQELSNQEIHAAFHLGLIKNNSR